MKEASYTVKSPAERDGEYRARADGRTTAYQLQEENAALQANPNPKTHPDVASSQPPLRCQTKLHAAETALKRAETRLYEEEDRARSLHSFRPLCFPL